jgi:hypothetical protein
MCAWYMYGPLPTTPLPGPMTEWYLPQVERHVEVTRLSHLMSRIRLSESSAWQLPCPNVTGVCDPRQVLSINRSSVGMSWFCGQVPISRLSKGRPSRLQGICVSHTGTSYLASQHIHRLGSVDNDAVCALDYRYAPRQVMAILKTCVCVCVQLR